MAPGSRLPFGLRRGRVLRAHWGVSRALPRRPQDWPLVGASEMRAFGANEGVRRAVLRDDISTRLTFRPSSAAQAKEFICEDLRTGTRAIATLSTSLHSWFDP